MFSACLWLSTSTRKLPFLVFLTVFRVTFVEITFSMKKGENLASQTSSKESIIMNLGKSAPCSQSLILTSFVIFFYLKMPYILYSFCWPCNPPPTIESNLCWEWTRGETHSPWLRQGYTTSILELRVGFQAVANFRFSALVKFLFSQCNWPSATTF